MSGVGSAHTGLAGIAAGRDSPGFTDDRCYAWSVLPRGFALNRRFQRLEFGGASGQRDARVRHGFIRERRSCAGSWIFGSGAVPNAGLARKSIITRTTRIQYGKLRGGYKRGGNKSGTTTCMEAFEVFEKYHFECVQLF